MKGMVSNLLLWTIFILLALGAHHAYSKTSKSQKHKKSSKIEVIMRTPIRNKIMSFDQAESKEVHTMLKELGMHPNRSKLCNQLSIQNLEHELELNLMIKNLTETNRPVLNRIQKATVGRVPLCDPFLVKLKTIALLLQNFHLVKINEKVKGVAQK